MLYVLYKIDTVNAWSLRFIIMFLPFLYVLGKIMWRIRRFLNPKYLYLIFTYLTAPACIDKC